MINSDKDLVIDPPSGWRYGFPKRVTQEEMKDLKSFLISNGYPEEDVELAMKYSRYWEFEETKKDEE